MFKVEINENLIKWYLDNQMSKPDPHFCNKARRILNKDYNESIKFSPEFLDSVKFLKEKKKILEDKLNLEESREIADKIQEFFRVDFSKIYAIKIFLLVHIGEGMGGTFCKGDPPLIFLRVSPDKKFSISIVWHEYMHYMADLSAYFKNKQDGIIDNLKIPESIEFRPRSIIEEGVIYVAEPLILKREIKQSEIDIKKLGLYRAWGAFRRQTLLTRKYFNLDNAVDSIPEDWKKFCELYF